jgi:hypothetical protein
VRRHQYTRSIDAFAAASHRQHEQRERCAAKSAEMMFDGGAGDVLAAGVVQDVERQDLSGCPAGRTRAQ